MLEPKVPAKSDEAPAVLAAPSEDPYFEYYGQAEAEIDAGTYDRNLWAKALIEAEGDELYLCRCGASSNKPFCDGSHKAAGFQG